MRSLKKESLSCARIQYILFLAPHLGSMWQCLRRTIRRNLYLQEDLIKVSYFRGQTCGLTWHETFSLIFGAQRYVLTCLKLFCVVPRALFYSQGFVGKTTLGTRLKFEGRHSTKVTGHFALVTYSSFYKPESKTSTLQI